MRIWTSTQHHVHEHGPCQCLLRGQRAGLDRIGRYALHSRQCPLDQKSQTDARSIQGENCTRTCNQTSPVWGDLISVHIAVAEGYTLQGAAVTVNGVKLDMERNITYAGSETQVKLVFGMPQEDATVIITPVNK